MSRRSRLLLAVASVLTLVSTLALEASARGGGPGGGGGGAGGGAGAGAPGMPGSRGAGPGRVPGGVGRVGDRAFGMGRFRKGGEKKEWESILRQADRKRLILERRERLLELDRHALQEAFLAEARGGEASQACLETFLR